MSPRTRGEYAVLEGRLGHTFREITLLETALVHRSYVNENPGVLQHNERLEFLGDAVLGLVVADLLMATCPERNEGELSAIRSRVVSEPALSKLGAELELGQWLFLGRGEELTGGRNKTSLLADAFEAVIGALYRDVGFEGTKAIVRRLLGEHVISVAVSGSQDFKSALQEWVQGRLRIRPRYEVVAEEGPHHEKIFEVAVWLEDRQVAKGRGRSKREAEQQAAEQAITTLRQKEDWLNGTPEKQPE